MSTQTAAQVSEAIDRLLIGSEHIVSFDGRSQYSSAGAGASACGIAAMNFARTALNSDEMAEAGREALVHLCQQSVLESILSVCAQWSGPAHLDVDDIYQAPIFQKSLSLLWQEYERPGLAQFQHLLRRLQESSSNLVVAVITRPPEIISVMKVKYESIDVFVIFDSHPRTKHPNGAALIFNKSADSAARYLADLLRYDSRLLEDRSLQWQAQLLANYSAHVFGPQLRPMRSEDWEETVLDSSLALLALRAEVASLEDHRQDLQSENQRLIDNVERLENEVADLREAHRSLLEKNSRRRSPPRTRTYASTSSTHINGSSSPVSPNWSHKPPPSSSGSRKGKENAAATMRITQPPAGKLDEPEPNNEWRIPESEWVLTPETSDATTLDSLVNFKSPCFVTAYRGDSDEEDPWQWPLAGRNQKSKSDNDVVLLDSATLSNKKEESDEEDPWKWPSTHRSQKNKRDDNAVPFDSSISSDMKFALYQQKRFDEEDRLLGEEYQKLRSSVPVVFNCGICMEDTSGHMIARPDPCHHEFCRDCIRGYIQAKIEEHRFPIICPLCALDRGAPNLSTLNSLFVEQIGLSRKEAELFMELELAGFSTLIHCRGCGGQAFVDKEEYQEAQFVACPLPRCRYAWCKSCSQPIEIGGISHSCDGTKELAHLMNSRGWKYCPGCKTPTEKSSGCNHMTCTSPGCNMHFCYVCGEGIVQSVRREDVSREVSAHYRRCRLFEDVPDHPERR